ncbi:hypothetical protein GCM10023336_24720 [Streptomyces similanensis]|uniref:Uncharacterized protein n=1 Tax=Streptomyces similanensis TaxID=1274988 RepID=A0ABP9KBL8_9ACTN
MAQVLLECAGDVGVRRRRLGDTGTTMSVLRDLRKGGSWEAPGGRTRGIPEGRGVDQGL